MRFPRVGLVLEKGRLTVAAITGPGALEVLGVEVDEGAPARLGAELEARWLSMRRLRAGLDRSLVTVKILHLPRATGPDLAQMVSFEFERHVPFPPDEMKFDWAPLPGPSDGPLRVLVVACERGAIDRTLRLLEAIRRRPIALTVACHELRVLLPRRLGVQRAVWAHRHGAHTDLLFLDRGGIGLSRSVPVDNGGDLAAEISRSLPLIEWGGCEAVWVSGDEAEGILAASELAALGAAVSAPPYHAAAATLIARLPAEQGGAGLLALAVAAGRRQPGLNLLPAEMRPRRPGPHQLITAGTAVATALVGIALLFTHGYTQGRYLARLSGEIRRLEPEVKAVERLAAELARQERLLATLRALEDGGIRPLPALRELTELVPADAWLQAVNMDRQGVELTGQATAASQLISLLEASPVLERVEFTSPVTKTQGKDQFRLRASWEGPVQRGAVPAGGAPH